MYVLQCPHDVLLHLFYFDLDLLKFNLFLLCSCVATCAPQIAGAGHPCYDRNLFFLKYEKQEKYLKKKKI